MSGQLNIDGGEDQPRSWDGEPLYSVETVAEGLFAADAFKQQRGQTALETDAPAIDNTPEAVEARRQMFSGFGWGVTR